MPYKLDIQIAKAKAENRFQIAEETYVSECKRQLKWKLTKAILLIILAFGLYALSYYHNDWKIFGHILFCLSVWFFYSYFNALFIFKDVLKKYKAEFAFFWEKYGKYDLIRYEYDEERVVCHEKNIDVAWKDLKSYCITEQGIFLYLEKDEIRIIKDLVLPEEYEHFDDFLKAQINMLGIPVYKSREELEQAKSSVKEIFKYVFDIPYPYVSILQVLTCIIIWAGMLSEADQESWTMLNKWGGFSYHDILNGNVIGLLSNTLVHVNFFHLFFNMYGLIELGSKIEKEEGSLKIILLFLSSAIVSSSIQLFFSDQMGIGFSGVLYAYFGFYMVARNYSEKYRYYLNKDQIAQLMAWLFICIALTYFDVVNIGNGAHFAGFFWGLGVGFLYYNAPYKIPVAIGMVAMMFASVLPLKWAPWSEQWLSEQAFKAHDAGRYSEAREYYDKILLKNPKNEWAKGNRELLPPQ